MKELKKAHGHRREFILMQNENLICEKCKANNGMIKVTMDILHAQQFVYFQCSSYSCNKREYIHILPITTKITPEVLKEILKDQGFIIP